MIYKANVVTIKMQKVHSPAKIHFKSSYPPSIWYENYRFCPYSCQTCYNNKQTHGTKRIHHAHFVNLKQKSIIKKTFMNQFAKKTSLLALSLLLGAGSNYAWDNTSDAELPQSSRRVVMMGNSITDYWLNHEVNNHKEFFTDNGALCRGVSGQKTPAMVERFTNDVVNLHPLVVVIAGGVNDINSGTTPEEVFANTKKMVEMAVKAGIRPILATINPSGWGKDTVDKYRKYNSLIKAYCEENGYAFCNYFDALKMSDTEYNEMKVQYRGRANNSDHLHPSKAGYLVMESILIPLIEDQIWTEGIYEAEHAAKKGTAIVDATDPNASNGSYVGWIGNGNTLSLGYNATEAGCYAFTFTYATGEARNVELTVNGTTLTVTCPGTGGYGFDNSRTFTMHLLLKKGYNTLVVGNENGNAPNIDKFEMVAAPENAGKALGLYFPKYSVIGDSFSTYQGYMETGVGEDDARAEYPQDKYDLTSVNDTWWKQYEALSGSKLAQNNSISGTCMSYISLNGSGTTKTVSFVNRITKMRQADLFIIEGGTNDFSGGRTTYTKATDATINGQKIVGEYKWDEFEADMPEYRFVRPAVAYMIYYLQYKYPGCTVVFMANNSIPSEGRESFRTICERFGAIYYEMYDIDKTNGHPSKAGMTSIANQLTETLVNYVLAGNKPSIELPQYYIYNVGMQKYIKTGGINKDPDSPTLVDSQEEATVQNITLQEDGTYLIADPDWQKGWGVQGRQTVYISTNGVESTVSWGTNNTPGWIFRSTGEEDYVHITYSWDDYTPGTYQVEDPSQQNYALYYGAYGQATDQWNRPSRNEVKSDGIYGTLYSSIAQYGDNAKWRIIPVKGNPVDVIPGEATSISPINTTQQIGNPNYYNLNGQVVPKNYKGIVIHNGKKILQ